MNHESRHAIPLWKCQRIRQYIAGDLGIDFDALAERVGMSGELLAKTIHYIRKCSRARPERKEMPCSM